MLTIQNQTTGPNPVTPWCCTRCRGSLEFQDVRIVCTACYASYECVDGIPDLRIPGDSWIDFEDDLKVARELVAGGHTLENLVRSVYSRRAGWDERRISLRTSQVLGGTRRLEADVEGWLSSLTRPDSVVLDLGCGAGMLLAAVTSKGCRGIGVDVSMTWLVVAKRLIAEHGGVPVLAAALGEALPLTSSSIDAVISLDVIEHVRDARGYLSEIDRVSRTGGVLALSTPNRFSLTAEPHVFVWGVGWVPHKWQAPFVRWRSGKTYDDTRLLSSFGLRRLLRDHTNFKCQVIIPPVPKEEIARFNPMKARLAQCYNTYCANIAARWLFLMLGPFFRVKGVKIESLGT